MRGVWDGCVVGEVCLCVRVAGLMVVCVFTTSWQSIRRQGFGRSLQRIATYPACAGCVFEYNGRGIDHSTGSADGHALVWRL